MTQRGGGPTCQRASESGAVGTLSGIEPNPLSADRTIRMDGEDSPETFGNASHARATWTVRWNANGYDCVTVPRSERNPERSRDCGPLDSDPRAPNAPRREATARTNWSSGAVGS